MVPSVAGEHRAQYKQDYPVERHTGERAGQDRTERAASSLLAMLERQAQFLQTSSSVWHVFRHLLHLLAAACPATLNLLTAPHCESPVGGAKGKVPAGGRGWAKDLVLYLTSLGA